MEQDLNFARVTFIPRADGDYQDENGERYRRIVALPGVRLYTTYLVYGYDEPTPYTPVSESA